MCSFYVFLFLAEFLQREEEGGHLHPVSDRNFDRVVLGPNCELYLTDVLV